MPVPTIMPKTRDTPPSLPIVRLGEIAPFPLTPSLSSLLLRRGMGLIANAFVMLVARCLECEGCEDAVDAISGDLTCSPLSSSMGVQCEVT